MNINELRRSGSNPDDEGRFGPENAFLIFRSFGGLAQGVVHTNIYVALSIYP